MRPILEHRLAGCFCFFLFVFFFFAIARNRSIEFIYFEFVLLFISAINMCMEGSISTDASRYVYLDSTGAPNYQAVSCTCELRFQYTGTLDIKYRSEGDDNCGIVFRMNEYAWSCEQSMTDTFVTQSVNNITYVKTDDTIRDAPACLGVKPG